MVNISIWEKRLEKAISELKTETRPSKIKILQNSVLYIPFQYLYKLYYVLG